MGHVLCVRQQVRGSTCQSSTEAPSETCPQHPKQWWIQSSLPQEWWRSLPLHS